MSLYGVQLDVNCLRIIHNMQMVFSHANGGWQVRQMSQSFHQKDPYRNMLISLADFEEVLKAVGIIIRSHEVQALAKYFDRYNDGRIDYHEFLDRFR
jgi:Ca2+-binding EF-hand superfamily protein